MYLQVQAPAPHNIFTDPSHSVTVMPVTHGSPSTWCNPIHFDAEPSSHDSLQFYDSLIDRFGYPAQVLCRMSDALFFYLDRNCPQHRNSEVIEPEKIFWQSVSLGNEADASEAIGQNLPKLYDTAGIPHFYNSFGEPVLDRQGYLHLCVFEVRSNPEECYEYWNKIMNIFKLLDPMTNIPFPTPIPRTVFPSYPNPCLKEIFLAWQAIAVSHLAHQRAQAQLRQYSGAYLAPLPVMDVDIFSHSQAVGRLDQRHMLPAPSRDLSHMHMPQLPTNLL